MDILEKRHNLLGRARGLELTNKCDAAITVDTRIYTPRTQFNFEIRMFFMALGDVYTLYDTKHVAYWQNLSDHEKAVFEATALLQGVQVRRTNNRKVISLSSKAVEDAVTKPIAMYQTMADRWDAMDLAELFPEEEPFRQALLRALIPLESELII